MAGSADNCAKFANIPGAERDCRLQQESHQQAWSRPAERPPQAPQRFGSANLGTAPTINESAEQFLVAGKQFYGAEHKTLQQLDPTFKQALDGADLAYQKAFGKAQSEVKATGGDLNKSVANLNAGTDPIVKEIGKLPPEAQAKMQKVIEENTQSLATTYESKGRNSAEGQAARKQFGDKLAAAIGPDDAKTIMTAVDKSYDALHDPSLKKYVKDVLPVQMKRLAMLDAYGEMAHLSGDTAKDQATQLKIAQIESTLPTAVQKSRADERAVHAAVEKKMGVAVPNGALDELNSLLHPR